MTWYPNHCQHGGWNPQKAMPHTGLEEILLLGTFK